jgi:putative oxidoreductase
MQLQYPDAKAGTRSTVQGLARYAPYVRSIVRIVVALLFFSHGLSKMIGFPQGPALPVDFSLHWFSGVLEFVGGALLAGGLLSRFAAVIMSGEMAFAYFLSHAPHGFFPQLNRGEGAILYCFIFLYFAFAGPGPWSLDALIKRERAG